MNPFEAPQASLEKPEVEVRSNLNWLGISVAAGVYFLVTMGFLLFFLMVKFPSSILFGVTQMLGLYVLPPISGAVCLAHLVKQRWIAHGIVYSVVPTTSIFVTSTLVIRAYLIPTYPLPLMGFVLGLGVMSGITLLSMAATRYLKHQNVLS